MTKVKFILKAAGFCEAKKSHTLRGAEHQDIKFYATFGLIVHPLHGPILFDTGYTKDFYPATKSYPFKIYAQMTKVFIEEEQEAKYQLLKEGINPEEVKYIILSHFHADHIGGLKDFPNAQVICTQSAYNAIKGKKGFSALLKGFIPHLMPPNFEQQVKTIDIEKEQTEDPILGKLYDVFNDGSIQLCALDGHAKGQIGALLQTEQGQVFLVADGAWLKANYTDLHLPSPIVQLFFDSWSDFKASLKRIHQYHKAHPETIIIPCHCEETMRLVNPNIE